jgi:hypothetical protein
MALSPDHIIVTVIPCGREDGKNSTDEQPYELKIRKKGNHYFPFLTNKYINILTIIANENSLKEIFLRKPNFWEKIFKQHLSSES